MTDIAVAAKGLIADCLTNELIGLADFHVCERLGFHCGEHNELAKLALAITVRELRNGSVCVPLDLLATDPEKEDISWPSFQQWQQALADSRLVTHGIDDPGTTPLRLVADRLYLERYWQAEKAVIAQLHRMQQTQTKLTPLEIAPELNNEQRAAVMAVADHQVTVLAGGPGTGKTRTAAAILAAYRHLPRIALAAPTGKAAARLEESVRELSRDIEIPAGTTMHRLLGLYPDEPFAPKYGLTNKLPYDLVIVDETSMLSLVMLRQLLEALADDTRVVFIGDHNQLASIDAGAVLADLVSSADLLPSSGITILQANYRFGSAISKVADAIRTGEVDDCLAAIDSTDQVQLIEADPGVGLTELPILAPALLDWADQLQKLANASDSAMACQVLDATRVLCAHREGPYGAQSWNRQIRRWLSNSLTNYGLENWYLGQPIMVNANSNQLSSDPLWNGDTGVVVKTANGLRAAIARGSQPLLVAPHLISAATELFAMTIHKSQGSQFEQVFVMLPPPDSQLLTKELLYTAVTRAKERLVIYGSKEWLAAAIQRRAKRASGLAS